MQTYEFWRETATQDVWAVELEEGVVVRCSGPLHWTVISPAFLPRGYDFRLAEAPELEARRSEFEQLERADIITMIGSSE
jgi:hypothetical protein